MPIDLKRRIKKTKAEMNRFHWLENLRKSLSRKPKILIIYALAVLIFFVSIFSLYLMLSSDKTSEKNYQQGMKDLSEGKFENAEENFKKAIGSNNDINALHGLAVSKYNQKDYQGAIEEYQRIIKIDPQNFMAYNGLGNLYRDQKKNDLAEENYKKANGINSSYVVGFSNLAIMLMDSGNYSGAKKVISQGLEKNPENQELTNLQKILESE